MNKDNIDNVNYKKREFIGEDNINFSYKEKEILADFFVSENGEEIVVNFGDERICLYNSTGEEIDEILPCDIFRKVKIFGKKLYWIESVDVFVERDLMTGKTKSRYMKSVLVDFYINEDTIFLSTSENKLITINNKETKSYAIGPRVVDKIRVLGRFVFLFAQFELFVFDIENAIESSIIRFNEQITASAFNKEKLYIGVEKKIHVYNLNSFYNNDGFITR